MAQVYLRPATVFDGNAIADIKNYYIENTDVIFTNEKVLGDVIAKDINDNKNKYLVAEHDSEVIGYACLLDYRSGGYYITKEVSVYVRQGSFKMGVGSSLLEALIDKSKLLGLSTLVAYISSSNAKSLSLFSRSGFENCGELTNVAFKDGKYLYVSILQLNLK